MSKIGEFSDFKKGSNDNIFRDIENTPLQERFKIEQDGSLGYRVDFRGVGPNKVRGHLTAYDLGDTK